MELRELFRSPLPSLPAEYKQAGPFVLGLAGWFAALGTYKLTGFGWGILAVWVGSIALFGWGIRRLDADLRLRVGVEPRDALAVLLLLAVFTPLYLVDLYSLPFPVHNDEVELMLLESDLTQPGTDLFGISQYLSMPIFLFSAFGWAGRAIGEIELTTMRAVHAGLGLLTIAVAYGLFRLSATRLVAFGAALILGVNHSLWMLSRMALWDNSALLLELAALAVLVQSLRMRSPFMAFIGGVVAGLGFYFYIPARVTVALWALLVVCLWFLFERKIERKRLLILTGASLAGAMLVISPLFITNTRHNDQYTTAYRLMITPEGLEHQRLHAAGDRENPDLSTLGGLIFNIEKGLMGFNSREWDGGGMYRNPDHGFVDPLTGAMLWVGLLSVVLSWRAGRLPRYGDLLAVSSFVFLLLLLALVINQAPNYTRMLVALPFAAYLAAKGLKSVSQYAGRLIRAQVTIENAQLESAFLITGLLVIGLWNFKFVGDYIQFSWEDGSIRGATARYLLERADDEDTDVFLIADDEYPYYDWGDREVWMDWVGFFTGPDQDAIFMEPDDFLDAPPDAPFVVLLSNDLFELARDRLDPQYPNLALQAMHPDGSVVAVQAD